MMGREKVATEINQSKVKILRQYYVNKKGKLLVQSGRGAPQYLTRIKHVRGRNKNYGAPTKLSRKSLNFLEEEEQQ